MQTRIKEYRARLSLTQDDLAKKVGVRRETIVFLEQGKYNPSLKLAHDVARTLHAAIDDLFIFDDDEQGQEDRVIPGNNYSEFTKRQFRSLRDP